MKARNMGMRRAALPLLAAACAALAPLAADAAQAKVATRDWVRRQFARIESRLASDTNAVIAVADDAPSVHEATIPLGDGTNALVTVYVPTNAGLFVAESSVPDLVPPHSFYAKAPGVQTYANVSNAYLGEIHYAVSNWTERAVRNGVEDECEHSRTKWTATGADGSLWVSSAFDGDTYLSMATNHDAYVVIRRTTITDERRDELLAGYGASAAAQAPPRLGPRLLSLLVPSALADEGRVVEVDKSGGGTLGYHQGVALGFTITLSIFPGERYAPPPGDHQYNPYSGTAHKDLAADESDYLNEALFSNPENWGFSFPLTMTATVDGKTKTIRVTKKRFTESPEWLDFLRGVTLPKPNELDEPEFEDASEHDCLVWAWKDKDGNRLAYKRHVGCVCNHRQCKYYYGAAKLGGGQYTYKIKKTWAKSGDVEWVEKVMDYEGALHNWAEVVMRLDENGEYSLTDKFSPGCYVCYQDPNDDTTDFCGRGDKYNISKDFDYTRHECNDPEISGRRECGCYCSKYWADESAAGSETENGDRLLPQTTQHVMRKDADGNEITRQKRKSSCWCYCLRKHRGTFSEEGETSGCPGFCKTCGCYKTYDGDPMEDRTSKEQMEWRVTDSGEWPDDPKELLKQHRTAADLEDGWCGCRCGVVNCDDEYTYNAIMNEDGWHKVKDGLCTCSCRRELHRLVNDTGHCAAICSLCGMCDGTDAQGNAVRRKPTFEDHTPDGKDDCGCQCYVHDDGYKADSAANVCGYSGLSAEASGKPAYHVKWPTDEKCGCVCGDYEDHAAHGLGKAKSLFVASPCEHVCAVCGKTDDTGLPAADSDHTAKGDNECGCNCGKMDAKADAVLFHVGEGSCPCLCECGRCHLKPDIETGKCAVCKVCGLTALLETPTGEDLHEPNPGAPCAGYFYGPENPDGTNAAAKVETPQECVCYCGYYGAKTHVAKDERLHMFKGENDDGTENCTCECKNLHVFREWTSEAKNRRTGNASVFCPVCAYCRALKKGDREDSPPVVANEADHVAKDKATDGTKCGCKCGKLDTSATLEKFHPKYPGGCRCYGTKGDGTGSWHYNNYDPNCTRLCLVADADGGRHLAASCAYNHAVHEATVPAVEADHTPKGTACGCRCGDYPASKLAASSPLHAQDMASCGCYCKANAEEHRYLARYTDRCYDCRCGDPEHRVHVQDPNGCYCLCNDRKKMECRFPSASCTCYCGDTTAHRWADGACVCYCKGKHRDDWRKSGCAEVCGKCGKLISNPKVTATFTDHTPSPTGCGCACGDYSGDKYDPEKFPKYHGGTGTQACLCACGAVHANFAASACPRACSVCGMTRDRSRSDSGIHVWGASCKCNCQRFTEHGYAADACWCYCATRFRGHDFAKTSDTVDSTYTCSTCQQTVEKHSAAYACNRCGATSVAEYESGHAWNCGSGSNDEPYSQHCDGCGCYNCSCSACQNLSGVCTNCGNNCGETKPTEGGGESGGDGGLDDI